MADSCSSERGSEAVAAWRAWGFLTVELVLTVGVGEGEGRREEVRGGKEKGVTDGVLHPLVVGGDVVFAVGYKEDFGSGDG